MQKCGVIDLGSNTIRLVVYKIDEKLAQKNPGKCFSNLISTKKTAGLSSYVESGVFTDAGIEKAASILEELLERASLIDCKDVNIFATAVLRNCKNSKKAVSAIEKQVGKSIDVISGEEEAWLDFVGASCNISMKRGTLIDIGGGSTELVSIKGGQAKRMVSMDQGSVSSYKQFVKHLLPTPEECGSIAQAFLKRLKDIPEWKAYSVDALYGVGGSIRALGKMHAALNGSQKAAKKLTRADIISMMELLEKKPAHFAHALTQAAPDRIHTLGCALAILHAAMSELDSQTVQISKYGIREGYLMEYVLPGLDA